MAKEEEEEHLKKLAINEKSQLGYIMEVQDLAGIKVYLGIPLTGSNNWVSLVPNIFDGPINAGALIEIAMHVNPPKKIKDKKIFSMEKTDGPIANWNALFTMEPGSDLNNIMNSLFKINPNNQIDPNPGDFHVDNENEDEDEIN
jgi:hypothetical protein